MANPRYAPYIESLNDVDLKATIRLFTCSPNPRKCGIDQYRNYMDHLWVVFSKFSRCMSEFVVSPELNENGNIHYHGWFVLKDKVKFYKHVLPAMKKLGFVKISKLKHRNAEWDYYCQKDYEIMKELCQPIPVPMTHRNYKNVINILTYLVIDGNKRNKRFEEVSNKLRSHSILEYINV